MAELSDKTLDALVERLAPRLADELAARGGPGSAARRLVDAQTLAHELGVTRAYVYQHARALGGRRLGDSQRGRWRFDLEQAKAAHLAVAGEPEPEPPPRSSRPAARGRRGAGPTLDVRPYRY